MQHFPPPDTIRRHAVAGDLRHSLWAINLLLFALSAVGIAATHLSVDMSGKGAIAVLVAIAWLGVGVRARLASELHRRLVDTIELIALFSLMAILTCVATYPIATLAPPLADPWLAAADKAIGFDWIALYRAIAGYPVLTMLSALAYSAIFAIPFVLFIALGMTGQAARAHRFMLAYGLVILVSVALFALAPAIDPIAYYGVETAGYAPITHTHGAMLAGLRDGTITEVRLGELAGMISFPSVHAASAILFVWAVGGIRVVTPVVAVLSTAMLAATPIEGNHYLIDLIAGAVAAVVAARVSGWAVWTRVRFALPSRRRPLLERPIRP